MSGREPKTVITRKDYLLREIPEDDKGLLNPKDIFSNRGKCFRPQCADKVDFAHLRDHYKTMHGPDAKSPPEIIYVIPKEGEVDATKLTSSIGTCLREECKRHPQQTKLDRHYARCHGPNATPSSIAHSIAQSVHGTLTEIPAEGEVEAIDLVSGDGMCRREECSRHPKQHNLKKHFKRCHGENANPTSLMHSIWTATYGHRTLTVIPEEGDVDVNTIVWGDGTCLRPTCTDHPKHRGLLLHYMRRHAPRVECPTCGNLVGDLRRHSDVHSGPARCTACGKVSRSLVGIRDHIRDRHCDDDNATGMLLTPTEVTELERRNKEAEERRSKLHPNRKTIREMKKELDKYQIKLKTSGTDLFIRAKRLKEELLEDFCLPGDAIIVEHASFVSVWEPDFMTTKLVLEFVERDPGGEHFHASSFYEDPFIPNPNQACWSDYSKTGFDRGHLAAARNFHSMLLVLPTYYHTNIIPMWARLNRGVRKNLEAYIRRTANKHGRVLAIHFPIMSDQSERMGTTGILIPDSIGTVMISRQNGKLHIEAWELMQDDVIDNFQDSLCDPFELFEKAEITFWMCRDSFDSVSMAM